MDGIPHISAADAIAVGREWGAQAPLAPLILHYENCETDENIERNVRRTLGSEYRSIVGLLAGPIDRELSICGFGPSLTATYKHLRGDVLACNGSHNWLIERGIVPKFALFWDASPVVAQFVNAHKDVTYLVASRCHESVFKALAGCSVYVWHCAGDAGMESMLVEHEKNEPMHGHGSAAVTTAMMVMTTLGYQNLFAFGADGSFSGELTHARKSLVSEDALDIWVAGRKFKSTSWLAGQVEDFKKIGPLLQSQGCTIEFYGDGLLPFVASLNGFKVNHTNITE